MSKYNKYSEKERTYSSNNLLSRETSKTLVHYFNKGNIISIGELESGLRREQGNTKMTKHKG